MSKRLSCLLGIERPIIMAPMFLVSNTRMIIEALECGITAAFPALNYRTERELRNAILEIKKASDKPFGVNLIVNKSNPSYKKQLKVLLELNVAFIITSLGNPKAVIDQCKPRGIKVFCDVVDLTYAKKVEALGADALIAVNNMAGGHSGQLAVDELVPLLKRACDIPIISAGGIANNEAYEATMELGADGVSIGTAFIASSACSVSESYKQAILGFSAQDIVMTNKMSGSPLTVIDTPFVKSINQKTGLLERLMYRHKFLKKFVKMLVLLKGKKLMEKSAFRVTYKTVWVAGPSIEHIHEIKTVAEIVDYIVSPISTSMKKTS